MQNKEKEIWLLTFGMFGMLLSALFVFAKYLELRSEAPVFAEEILKKEISPTSLPSATVLGETMKSSCPTAQEFIDTAAKVRPELIIYKDTTPFTIPTEDLLQCATAEQTAMVNDCPAYELSYQKTCLEKVVSQVNFTEQTELIASPDSDYRVEVRISDDVVDVSKLPNVIETNLQKEIVYKTIMSPYITVRQMVMQAPVSSDFPNTQGEVASRYIEVDGSRQLLFIWENGQKRAFRTSGAFPEYNPVGVHRILNKSPMAWSSTASKWMPFWMAFTYDKKQRAWLGFHALVFWYPGFQQTGDKKIYEPISNIGKPRSTGCIRMSEADARGLFDWAKVGDLVVVHQ